MYIWAAWQYGKQYRNKIGIIIDHTSKKRINLWNGSRWLFIKINIELLRACMQMHTITIHAQAYIHMPTWTQPPTPPYHTHTLLSAAKYLQRSQFPCAFSTSNESAMITSSDTKSGFPLLLSAPSATACVNSWVYPYGNVIYFIHPSGNLKLSLDLIH